MLRRISYICIAFLLSACSNSDRVSGLGSRASGPEPRNPNPESRSSRSYYLSTTGDDSIPGTSEAKPWRTIDRLNTQLKLGLRPGDQILFHSGETFVGNLILTPNDSGDSAQPIRVTSYGTGQGILIPQTTTDEKKFDHGSAIECHSVSHIAISNLILRGPGVPGSGAGRSTSCGLAFDGQGSDIHIENLNISGFTASAINFCHDLTFTDNRPAGHYTDVSITKSSAHDNGFGGMDLISCDRLLVDSCDASYNVGYAYILDCGSGFGIRLWGCNHAVVQNCNAEYDHRGTGQGGSTGAIEANQSSHILFQHNQASHDHEGIFDGDGIVFDGVRFGVMQFNYTHNNDGGGLLVGGDTTCGSGDFVTARYNISRDDARDTQPYCGALIWGDINHALFYNNTIITTASRQPALKFWIFNDPKIRGKFGSVLCANNNLITSGNPLVLLTLDDPTAKPAIELLANNYWPQTSPFNITWNKTTFANLAAFTKATNQESRDGHVIAQQSNPDFVKPFADNVRVTKTSPLSRAGLSLAELGTTWDPYNFAADPFLKTFFNPIPTDFYGSRIPATNSTIGAAQTN